MSRLLMPKKNRFMYYGLLLRCLCLAMHVSTGNVRKALGWTCPVCTVLSVCYAVSRPGKCCGILNRDKPDSHRRASIRSYCIVRFLSSFGFRHAGSERCLRPSRRVLQGIGCAWHVRGCFRVGRAGTVTLGLAGRVRTSGSGNP